MTSNLNTQATKVMMIYRVEKVMQLLGVSNDDTKNTTGVVGDHRHLLQMSLKGDTHLCCSAISSDGTWIACSDTQQRNFGKFLKRILA
eukprot:TRINITY_DN14228_c0_g1_i1.p1 TRINITY_DN14228_c0_g1~~TRINITY_DN14228_c0_g1_i1.p1  ORF type:complete len:88 (-),score=18.75 TRINITY_DN14228_c0_g1_i1:318-581(-)